MTTAIDTWTKQYGDKFRVWLGTKPFVVISKPDDLEVREIAQANKFEYVLYYVNALN